MPNTGPDGFHESWYTATQRELGELHTLVVQQQATISSIQATQERMEQRLDAHGARLAQVAMGAVVAALLIPIIPDTVMMLRTAPPGASQETVTRS